MKTETQSMHITPIRGNVFADLGFGPEEATNMQAESQRIIAEKRASMDRLMVKPNERIEEKQPE